MSNKRTLKSTIKLICAELIAECIASSLQAQKSNYENIAALLFSIVKMEEDFTSRISHPEPGMPAKQYFRELRSSFSAQVSDIIDQINNMH